MTLPSCSFEKGLYWVLTEGAAGMRNQAIGLAEAMGALRWEHHKVELHGMLSWLEPYVRLGWADRKQQFQPPWPAVIIACGRKAITSALWLKKHVGRPVVYVQDPYISPRHFDAVVAPSHDDMKSYPNVMPMLGACHRVNEKSLRQARDTFAASLGVTPPLRRSLFLGGANRCFTMPLQLIHELVQELQQAEGTLWVSVSRRTSPEIMNMLRAQKNLNLITPDDVPNPYMGLLAWSDVCVLTCDSVSMASEVMSAGIPLYLVRLPGGNRKFARFHQDIESRGLMKWWKPGLPVVPYSTKPLHEMQRVAAWVHQQIRNP